MPLTRRTLCAIALLASGAAASADPWSDLIRIEQQIAANLAVMQSLLESQDNADRVAVALGLMTAADADVRLAGYGRQLYYSEIGERDLAAQRAQLEAGVQAYLAAIEQAAAGTTTWPDSDVAYWQQRARSQIAGLRAELPGWLQQGLDPAPLIERAAQVAGWTRGERQSASVFSGHGARVVGAVASPAGREALGGVRAAITPSSMRPAAPDSPVPRAIPTEMGTPRPSTPPAPPLGPGPASPPPAYGADELREAGYEPDTDHPGMDITSFDLDDADPTSCMTACQDYGGCRFFTYVKPGVLGPAARCFLKSGVPPAQPNTCCISGTP